MKRKEIIAMLLAGGQGSRLKALTKRVAKPAVSFAGKYRIIDFSLSNCTNSGIDTVGVLTQYKPYLLNSYLGTGEAWDLDSKDGGVRILPPYETEAGGNWYAGTADAIYCNINFIDEMNPEYVLILSGDHIYSMDYNAMLQYHKKNNADLTVSVIEVSIEEASRFGIMTVDENNQIIKFTEKPSKPDSTLASMGLYIFSWNVLRKSLIEDHDDKKSEHDFGKNIIPKLLTEKKRLFAYTFKGYWKDVGTIDSYFETTMQLLKDKPEFNIYDKNIKIFSNQSAFPPHFISEKGSVENSLVCNGSMIFGSVKDSVLASNVRVDEGAKVIDSILLPGVRVMKGARVTRAIVGENTVIERNIKFGSSDKKADIALVGDNEVVKK